MSWRPNQSKLGRPLTGFLSEVAEVVADATGKPAEGLRAALAIAEVRGGQRIRLAADPAENDWLVQAVGEEAARIVAGVFAGEQIDVPAGPRGTYLEQARARRGLAEAGLRAGLTIDEIVRQTGCSRRMIFYYQADMRSGAKGDDRQMRLFDDDAA